jgi:hypothetical protein
MLNKILFFLFFSFNCYASTVTTPYTYSQTDTVTNVKLNNNQSAIVNVINGGLDNTNANTTLGYHFFQAVGALPTAGNQGSVYYLTADNSLNFDTGSTFIKSVVVTSPSAGQTPVYNGSAWIPTTVGNYIPTGAIILWSGSIGSIPTGWALCDGTNGTPDLRNRFVIGAGSTYAVGASGGSATKNISGTTGGPSATGGSGGSGASGVTQTHTHDFTVSNQDVLNPYYSLAYIMKT